jgi:hypothetical protein
LVSQAAAPDSRLPASLKPTPPGNAAVGWRAPPVWLLGFLVALLGWRVGMNPPTVGLDASWNAGLAMAAEEGLQFGQEIVFSYGPLGFLQTQSIWYGDTALLSFLYLSALYVGFCIALVWSLRRLLPALPSILIVFAIVAVLPLLEQAVLLVVLVSMRMLEREASTRAVNAFVLGGASFAAVLALIKLSTGPLIPVLLLIALIGMRARWWQLLGFAWLTGVELGLLWLATGQSPAAVPDFLHYTWEMVSGYSAAMLAQPDVAAWKVTAATLAAGTVAAALVAATALRASHRDDRARWAAVALMGLAAFATFKQGVVRTDAGHLSLFFSTACVLWIAIPWARERWRWMVVGAGLIAAMGVPVRPPGLPTNLNAADNLKFAFDQVRSLVSGSRREELRAAGREAMIATYALDPQTLALLRGHSVAVEPWEAGVAWAYRFEWGPWPVFQNYSAYTAALDDLNAAAVADPAGPDRILRENPALVYPEFLTRGIDGRFPGWDPPAQALATLCHFAALRTTARWQVLGRTANRCGPTRFAGSAETGPGTPVRVPVPGAGEVVFARVDGVEVSGFERLLALLARPRVRTAVINGTRRYRLLPATAADGLLLRGDDRIGGRGAFAQIPQATTVAIDGASGDLRFDFYRMRVRKSSSDRGPA